MKEDFFMGKKIPMWQCVLVLVLMMCFLMWGILKDSGGEAHIGLILSACAAGIVAVANGWKWAFIEQGICSAINRSMQACLILAIVGAMIASWTVGGVVPSMMYFGIKVIAPSIFLFTACILCAIVSLATGSSWSTAGSMGVALIGVGTALGFSSVMTAGAVVSGAYFGDKMSPLSDTTNLAPAVAGSNLFDHIKHMIYTTGPSLIVALIAYLVMGFMHSGSADADTSQIDLILGFITDNFKVGIIYLIPPVFVIVAVALKLPAIPSLLGGVFLGVPFMLMQGTAVTDLMNILNNGYEVAGTGDPVLDELAGLLSCSGLQGMFWTISLILCAMSFGGIVDCTGIMGTLAGALLKVAKGRGGLVLATAISCLFINATCCDQYLAIILPGRMFKEAFEDMHLAPKNLSRCLEDVGTITSNFFPWNTCGATMRSFLGVGSGYIPYAVLNWFNPLVSIFYGYTGITMVKMTDEEYQKVLERREAERQQAMKAMEA